MLVLGGISVLSACSSAPEKPVDVPIGRVSPDDAYVLARLSKTADSIDHHIKNLERESLRNIHIKPLPAPSGMAARLLTMNFDGPMEAAVSVVGTLIHYKVLVSGRRPAVPLVVSIHMKRRSAQAIIESIGLQTGRSVGIHFDEVANRIEVIYLDNGTRRYPLLPGERHDLGSSGQEPSFERSSSPPFPPSDLMTPPSGDLR